MSDEPETQMYKQDDGVFTVKTTNISMGWEQWIMFTSDHHYDNKHTDRKLLKRHLEKARQRNAWIMHFGDQFCAMQGKYDRRKSMDDIRPEHVGENYLDLIVKDAVDFYKPYADLFKLTTMGNHEYAILKNNGTSLLSNFAYAMNVEHKGNVQVASQIDGWVRFMFEMNGSRRQSKRLYFHHGAGGGGPVTKGTIQTNRQAVYINGADIVVNGHTHDGWVLPLPQEQLSDAGKRKRSILWFLRTPSYKNPYGKGGWDDNTWKPPKPLGCIWGRFYMHAGEIRMEFTPDIE